MKKIKSVMMAAAALFVINVQQPPMADDAIISNAKQEHNTIGKSYKVNLKKTTLNWTGTKASGQHSGTINITEGNLIEANGTLGGGSFIIDLNTITDTDMTGKGKESLEGHLKAPDFFDVAKYSTAKFAITGVAAIEKGQATTLPNATHNITGNLTLKGVTKSVTFPAQVTMSKKAVAATANFNIDRTEWGITYGEGKVNKEINLKLNLVAGK